MSMTCWLFMLLSFSILVLPWLLDLFNIVIQIPSASCYLDLFKGILEKYNASGKNLMAFLFRK
jgi:hypothetical protein